MTRSLSLVRLVSFAGAVGLAAGLSGCGGDSGGGSDASAPSSHDVAPGCPVSPTGCPTTGMGTLAIVVEGLPPEVPSMVLVTGPAGAVPFAASARVGGGSYHSWP